MDAYIDGLAWAAVNVCMLQFPAGHVSSFYMSGSIMIIAGLLAVMLPDNNR